jgi:23S rRNA (uracil1939-C5)-methyltransferase
MSEDLSAGTGDEGLRPGAVLDVDIEKGVYRGLGLARVAGRVVFVRRGLAGDRLRVRIESLSPGYARAELLEVLRAGPARRGSPCPFFAACGGCAYQELAADAQLALKQAVLVESLARAGVAWEGAIRAHASPEQGWRTRASFHLQTRGRELALGLRAEGTHRVVDLPHCLQLSAELNQAFRAVARAFAESPAQARLVRDVDIAESLDGSRRVACLEGELDARSAAKLTSLAESVPQLAGLGAQVGAGRSRRFLSLRGEPYLEATVLGVRLRSHVLSFFQANRFLVETLARTVCELVPAGGRVLDLYAGVGLFALPLARSADEVLAVEQGHWASRAAEANAQAAGAGNLRVWRAEVLEALAACRVEPDERIVLDPPRTGAGVEVVRAIAARRPVRVVYVSCDPPTLARDLKQFEAAGYRPDHIELFDLFPDTMHLETVVALRL